MEQIQVDRARLRGLLTEDEFRILDNCLRIDYTPQPAVVPGIRAEATYNVSTRPLGRACHVLLYFLFCLGRDTAIFAKEWGWLERCLNLADVHVALLMRAFEAMDQNITTPLPLPYCHLCKTLMFSFLLAFPFCLNRVQSGLLICTITPCIIATAMFGMESISMEIEDPFGDDLNDFAVMRIVSSIEDSMYETMVCRNDPATENFVWIQPPPMYKDCSQFLALGSEQSSLFGMCPGAHTVPVRPLSMPERTAPSAIEHGIGGAQFPAGASGSKLWRYNEWTWK